MPCSVGRLRPVDAERTDPASEVSMTTQETVPLCARLAADIATNRHRLVTAKAFACRALISNI